jgi:hypothetical protein
MRADVEVTDSTRTAPMATGTVPKVLQGAQACMKGETYTWTSVHVGTSVQHQRSVAHDTKQCHTRSAKEIGIMAFRR